MNDNNSNVPDSFQVTRNGITLEYVKVPAKRKGKGGKTLPPVFCPQIDPASDSSLSDYRKFCGDELFFADLQASVYQRCIRQQQKFTADGKETSCWSADGSKFDEETAIRNAQLASVKAETTSDLIEEMKSIAEEFTKANAEGNATRVAELRGMMAENLQKQASKKHSK